MIVPELERVVFRAVGQRVAITSSFNPLPNGCARSSPTSLKPLAHIPTHGDPYTPPIFVARAENVSRPDAPAKPLAIRQPSVSAGLRGGPERTQTTKQTRICLCQSAGSSRNVETPCPCGRVPSRAARRIAGARNARLRNMRMERSLQPSRAAISFVSVTRPSISSLSQRRALAIPRPAGRAIPREWGVARSDPLRAAR